MSNTKVLCTKLVLNITKLAGNIRLPMDVLKTGKDIKKERKSDHNALAPKRGIRRRARNNYVLCTVVAKTFQFYNIKSI